MNEQTEQSRIIQEIGQILAKAILRQRQNLEIYSLDLPPSGSVYADKESTHDA